jgi:hypothetical protein
MLSRNPCFGVLTPHAHRLIQQGAFYLLFKDPVPLFVFPTKLADRKDGLKWQANPAGAGYRVLTGLFFMPCRILPARDLKAGEA